MIKKRVINNKMKFFILFFVLFLIFYTGIYSSSEINKTQEISYVTAETALREIKESELIMNEMKEKGLSIFYVNDSLTNAKRIFEQIKYAEVLRKKENVSSNKFKEAEDYLKLVDWRNLNYSDILFYAEEIKIRKIRAYNITDEIFLIKTQLEAINTEKNLDLKNATYLFNEGKIAFIEDRYDDSENYLESARIEIEKQKAYMFSSLSMGNSVLNFFQRYIYFIIIFIVFFVILMYFSIKNIRLKVLKHEIERLKFEKNVLKDLMKKNQEDRFKKNIISGIVYKIRNDKYSERLNKIDETLPVLDGKLKASKKQKIK